MNRAHIWSDVPGDHFSGSSGWDAEEHAEEEGGLARNVNSIDELLALFNEWLHWEESFDVIDFHTHGGPGVIHIGSDSLTTANLFRLYTSNLDSIFRNNAQIIFNGCNVGEGFRGEHFLWRFGNMMLKAGGGKVMGSSGLGLADAFISGDVYHPLGGWVTAEVGIGGGAKLSGHKDLVPGNIDARIRSADERIESLESDGSMPLFEAFEVKSWLMIARMYVANPTYDVMFDACDHLRMVEMKLKAKERNRILKGIPKNAIK